MSMALAELTTAEARALFQADQSAIIPTGSTEQHGQHLPLGTDHETALAVALQAGEQAGVPVTPVIPFGMSRHHIKAAGTITFSAGTYMRLVSEVCESLFEHGVRRVLIVNGHGGNNRVSQETMDEIFAQRRGQVVLAQCHVLGVAGQIVPELKTMALGHADVREASIMMWLKPHTVHLERQTGQHLTIGGQTITPGLIRRGIGLVGHGEASLPMRYSALVLVLLSALLTSGGVGGIAVASPAKINELVIAIGGDALTLDPTMSREASTDMVVGNIFDALMVRDQDMKAQPHLLEHLKNVDEQTWEIKLKRGIRFTNGEPLDYEAIKYTFDVIFDKTSKSVLPTWLAGIIGVDKIDDLTMRIKTRGAMPLMAQNLTLVYPVPPKAHRERGTTGFAKAPVGTGPYKLDRWVKDSHIALVANDSYWGGKPPFPRVTFKVIPEDGTRVSAFLTGEVHIVQNVPIPDLDRVRQVGQAVVVASGRMQVLQLNAMPDGPHKLFLDKRVRQAVAYALDVDSIVRELFKGTATRIATFLHPKYFGYDASFKPYPYDPNKARQLLAAAGYPNGFDLGINAAVGIRPMDKETVEAMAGQLNKVGIRARVVSYEYVPFLAAWRNKKLEGAAQMIGILSLTWDADGAFFLRFAKNQPMGYYTTDPLDRLVREARTTIDPGKR